MEVIKKLHKDQAQEIKTFKLKLENLQTLKDAAFKVFVFPAYLISLSLSLFLISVLVQVLRGKYDLYPNENIKCIMLATGFFKFMLVDLEGLVVSCRSSCIKRKKNKKKFHVEGLGIQKAFFFFFKIPKVISIELHVHHAMTVGKLLQFFYL